MVRTRVEEVLKEIARLTPEEKTELVHTLPIVLRSSVNDMALPVEVLEAIHNAWIQMRVGLRSEGETLGTVADDLEMLRDERDAQLLHRHTRR